MKITPKLEIEIDEQTITVDVSQAAKLITELQNFIDSSECPDKDCDFTKDWKSNPDSLLLCTESTPLHFPSNSKATAFIWPVA